MKKIGIGNGPRVAILLVLLAVMGACSEDAREGDEPEPFDEDAVFTILEDRIHSSRQHTGVEPSFSALSYNSSHGFSNFKHYAESLGGSLREVSEGRIDAKDLEGVDILFINLVDDDHPAFAAEEVAAIEAYVREGGGLFVIVDHTNAYYSSERINVLLAAFGLEVLYSLACDVRERTIKLNHWIRITDPVAHPVTEGVASHVYFASGPIVGPGALAMTSDDGWQDTWNPDAPPSYWGNFTQDDDEPNTSSSVLNALQHGQGRVVVVGDQNIFGNTYWGVADNRRLLANIWQWLAELEDGTPWRDGPLPKPELLVDFRVNEPMNFYSAGYNPLYYNLARQPWYYVTLAADEAYATPRILVLPEPLTTVDEDDLAYPGRVLDAGGQVYLFVDPLSPSQGALDTLSEFWPEFVMPTASSREFENGVLLGIENRERAITDALDVAATVGERVVWIEGDGVESDVMVRKGKFHVVLQPDIFGDGQTYAVEGLLDYMHERDAE